MLTGALIGVLVAVIVMMMRSNSERNALKKAMNPDVLDTPDYAAFFQYASESTFHKKMKFIDSNGALTISGTVVTYTPQQRNKSVISFDITKTKLKKAPEKRKMKWLEVDLDGTKHYFTTFKQNAFSVDKAVMDKFLRKLAEIRQAHKTESTLE